MTELQIKAAQLREDNRHNLATERLTKDLNAAQAEHLKTSDRYTEEHYQRSDQAGLISANSNAMNAQTNLQKYKMDYDIEYGWTGNSGYPQGMPLSAQKKNAEIEYFTLDENSKMPAVQLELEKRKAENSKARAEALNKVTTAYTSILNSVFGKGGVVKTVEELTE